MNDFWYWLAISGIVAIIAVGFACLGTFLIGYLPQKLYEKWKNRKSKE